MTEKRFWYDFEDANGQRIVDFKYYKIYPLATIGDFREVEDLLNEQHEQIERLKRNFKVLDEIKCELAEENEQLKQQIKDLRVSVLDSIHEAEEIQCSCNPCVVEECVKKVVE